MKSGHGEVVIAEGDPEVLADHERLVEEFRRQLDEGLWAAVPLAQDNGRRQDRTSGSGAGRCRGTLPER